MGIKKFHGLRPSRIACYFSSPCSSLTNFNFTETILIFSEEALRKIFDQTDLRYVSADSELLSIFDGIYRAVVNDSLFYCFACSVDTS